MEMEMAAKKRRISTDRHIPAVLTEKILLNLPIKSLFRFSTVSEAWASIIFGSEFAKSYRGRELIMLRSYSGEDDDGDEEALVCPLSSLSSEKPLDRATPFARPFKAHPSPNASCGKLWCVEFEERLILYNPSIRAYRKLPIPLSPVPIGATILGSSASVFVYGLGYDCVADDYKILKIHRDQYVEAELYSLKSDCWRIFETRPCSHMIFLSAKSEFVSGKFHWRVKSFRFDENKGKSCFKRFILTFDLLTEEYGEINLPESPKSLFKDERRYRRWNMFVFGGKLRVCLNYGRHSRFAVWVYDEDEESWRKELDIDYGHMHPLCYNDLKPFYFYDSGGNEMKGVVSSMDMRKMFVCEDGKSLVEKNFGGNGCGMFDTYVESFALFRHAGAQEEGSSGSSRNGVKL